MAIFLLDLNTISLNSSYQTKPLLHLGLQSEGVLHVSILAHDSAHVIFTQDESLESGFSAGLGGWLNKVTSNSSLRYCHSFKSRLVYSHCDYFGNQVKSD